MALLPVDSCLTLLGVPMLVPEVTPGSWFEVEAIVLVEVDTAPDGPCKQGHSQDGVGQHQVSSVSRWGKTLLNNEKGHYQDEKQAIN